MKKNLPHQKHSRHPMGKVPKMIYYSEISFVLVESLPVMHVMVSMVDQLTLVEKT